MSGIRSKHYVNEMIEEIYAHIKCGNEIHLQWECMGCHEKVTSDDPMKLVLNDKGEECVAFHKAYLHTTDTLNNETFCGVSTPVTAKAFNFMIIMGLKF